MTLKMYFVPLTTFVDDAKEAKELFASVFFF